MTGSISVVIPSARQYPASLIDDLLTQTRQGDEILLVNDDTHSSANWTLGSETTDGGDRDPEPDDSPSETGAGTEHERLSVLQTAGRGGGAQARNVGWRASSTEWVLFVNDDMQVSPGLIESIRASIEENRRADVVSFRVTSRADDPITRLSDMTVSLDRGPDPRETSGSPLDLDQVRNYGVGAALLTSREILEETGGYKDELGPGRPLGGTDDIEFLWHVSHHDGSIAYDPSVVFYHRSPGSLEEWQGKLEDYARTVGYLTGVVGTAGAERWATGYCEILESVHETESFGTIPADLQPRAKRALSEASETIRDFFDGSPVDEAGPELLCGACDATFE